MDDGGKKGESWKSLSAIKCYVDLCLASHYWWCLLVWRGLQRRLGRLNSFLFPWSLWPSNLLRLFLLSSVRTLGNHNRFIAQARATICYHFHFPSHDARCPLVQPGPWKNRLFSPWDSWIRLAAGIEAVSSKWRFCPGRNHFMLLHYRWNQMALKATRMMFSLL